MYTLHSMSVWQFYIDFLNVGSTRISGYHSKYCISQCFPQQIFSEMMGMQTFLPVVVWQATYSSDLHCQLIFHIANLKQVAKFVKHITLAKVLVQYLMQWEKYTGLVSQLLLESFKSALVNSNRTLIKKNLKKPLISLWETSLRDNTTS